MCSGSPCLDPSSCVRKKSLQFSTTTGARPMPMALLRKSCPSLPAGGGVCRTAAMPGGTCKSQISTDVPKCKKENTTCVHPSGLGWQLGKQQMMRVADHLRRRAPILCLKRFYGPNLRCRTVMMFPKFRRTGALPASQTAFDRQECFVPSRPLLEKKGSASQRSPRPKLG
jgi:hypothetical protein